MSLRNEQCNKVCRILDDVLANRPIERDSLITAVRKAFGALEPEPQWISVSERLPRIGLTVLLATNNGSVFIGHREKPEIIWQVAEENGRRHWVYDPEAYTDDIDNLPKGEDCSFDDETRYAEVLLSVSSPNYNDRFEGVTAWMPFRHRIGKR